MTHQTLKSGSLVGYQSQRIVEHETIVKSFATRAKRHVRQMLDDWRITEYLAKTIIKHSVQVSDLSKALKEEPTYARRRLVYAIHTFEHPLVMHAVKDANVCTWTEISILTLPALRFDRVGSCNEKSWIRVIPRGVPIRGMLIIHPVVYRPSRLSPRTEHGNTCPRC